MARPLNFVRIETVPDNEDFLKYFVGRLAIVHESDTKISVITQPYMFRAILREIKKQQINPYTVMKWIPISSKI